MLHLKRSCHLSCICCSDLNVAVHNACIHFLQPHSTIKLQRASLLICEISFTKTPFTKNNSAALSDCRRIAFNRSADGTTVVVCNAKFLFANPVSLVYFHSSFLKVGIPNLLKCSNAFARTEPSKPLPAIVFNSSYLFCIVSAKFITSSSFLLHRWRRRPSFCFLIYLF